MEQLLLNVSNQWNKSPIPSTLPQWLRINVAEIQDSHALVAKIYQLSGLTLKAFHIEECIKPLHTSYYDANTEYACLVFRSILPVDTLHNQPIPTVPTYHKIHKKNRYQLPNIAIQPIVFFISDHVLISIQHSEQIDLFAYFSKLIQLNAQHNGQLNGTCTPICITPYSLLLRFINMQVDTYLNVRQPLTIQLDRWQRELLDPRRTFSDWASLLNARLELRKIESLSEEQLDALAELKESWLDNSQLLPNLQNNYANLSMRLQDIMDHIDRVLSHAKRLESSIESTVQLHFAAVAHQTNRTVRNLTILTGVFAPLSLITGFYGMNVALPWQHNPYAIWWIMLGMLISSILVLGSLIVFKYLNKFISRV